jgi:hypothetical protein
MIFLDERDEQERRQLQLGLKLLRHPYLRKQPERLDHRTSKKLRIIGSD